MAKFKNIEHMELASKGEADLTVNMELVRLQLTVAHVGFRYWLRVVATSADEDEAEYNYYIDGRKSSKITRDQAEGALLLENMEIK